MTHLPRWSSVPVLLLMSVLIASPASAAARGPAAGWLDVPGNLLSGLWQSVVKLVPAIAASRGGMDPDGQPTPTTTSEDGDSRYGMDPDGRT
jgi:cation transporter-like permease